VTIDGYSQPGASLNTLAKGTDANLLVELDGINLLGPSTSKAFNISTSDVVVRGLVINRFDSGINIISTEGPTDNNRIEGNFIGTDPTGTQALSAGTGVVVVGLGNGENNIVGGTSPAARNLISGNDFEGVLIKSASGTKVLGNLIGTQKDGTTPLGNASEGVDIFGAERTIVGGTTPGAANTVAFNGDYGVLVSGPSSGNRILSNSIFSNRGLGIDLIGGTENAAGATKNDALDADLGPNGLQNKPVLTSATTSGGTTTLKGRLDSTPNTAFTVQFFSNPSGTDEGKKFVGQKRVRTNSEGKVSFTFVPSRRVGAGQPITATATGPEGTSEFSAPRTVTTS
jgi:hypothetical protein